MTVPSGCASPSSARRNRRSPGRVRTLAKASCATCSSKAEMRWQKSWSRAKAPSPEDASWSSLGHA